MTALRWADEIGPPPVLPVSLIQPEARARLVHAINTPLIRGSHLHLLDPKEKRRRLAELAELTQAPIPDVFDAAKRTNIALRIWAGCIHGAKTIALKTENGPNTPEGRSQTSVDIDRLANRDPIFRAGVEAAPLFKKLIAEEISLDGVLPESPLRTYI